MIKYYIHAKFEEQCFQISWVVALQLIKIRTIAQMEVARNHKNVASFLFLIYFKLR